MIILAELQPLDRVSGTRKTLRASSANDERVTGLNSLIWRPAIIGEPSISIRLFKGDFDGDAAPAGGSLEIQIDQFLSLEPTARSFVWQGAPVKLWAGTLGQAWPWTQVFDGLVDTWNAQTNTVSLTNKVNTTAFDADVLTLKYAGNGGAEGGADLKDKVKPFLLGRCFNVEPVLVNAVDSIYQFSSYGPVQAIQKLYERGSEFPASIGDYATYAALLAAVIAPGKWASCNALGMFRLGAPAYGVITGDVDGDAFGGTWRRRTGEIIKRVASNSNVLTGLIETASFDALDTALAGFPNQGRIGIFIDSQETVLEIAARLAAPCNAQVGVSLLGKMFVGRVAIASPTLTLDAQQRQLPRVVSSSEESVSPPYSYMEFGYARSWRVHTPDEISYYGNIPVGTTFIQPTAPTAAESAVGNTWLNEATGYIYDRVPSDGMVLNWDVFTIGGDIPVLVWTPSPNQPVVAAYAQAAAAQATANAATISANAATARLIAIDDDDVLTIDEKVRILGPENTRLEAVYQSLLSTAGSLSVSTTAATLARAAWFAARNGVSPAWNNIAVDTAIVRGSWDSALGGYNAALAALSDAIKAKSATLANWSNISGQVNAPANNATVGAQAGANLLDASGNPLTDALIKNSQIVINSDGTASYFNGVSTINLGAVTLTGMGGGALAFRDKAGYISETTPTTPTPLEGMYWFKISTGEIRSFTSGAWSSPVADLTAASQVTASLSPDKSVVADYLGAVTSENLASLIWGASVVKGGASVKGLDSTAYAISGVYGGTFAVDNANGSSGKGNITISAIAANSAGGNLVITVGGADLPALPFKVTKDLVSPPSPSSGTDSESWEGGEFNSLNSASYVAISTVKTITLATGQSLYGQATLEYYVSGVSGAARTLSAKWQYSVAGANSWSDFSAGVTGSTAYAAFNGGPPEYDFEASTPGNITIIQTKAGLSANNWDVRLVGILDATGRTATILGAGLMEAKA